MSNLELQVEVESKCPLNCLHCSSATNNKLAHPGYRPEDVLALIDRLEHNIVVNLTGGEPLFNSHLADTIHLLKSSINTDVGIFSSGMCFDKESVSSLTIEQANRLADAGLSCAYISIYHCDGKKHDLITGLHGSHKLTLTTISNLLKAGITVKAHVVVTGLNMRELHDIVLFLYGLNILQVRLLRLVKSGNASKTWREIGAPLSSFNHYIFKLMSCNLPVDIRVSGFPELMACRPFNDSSMCQAGSRLLYITHDGSVFPCACLRNKPNYYISHIANTEAIVSHLARYHSMTRSKCMNSLNVDRPNYNE